MHLPTSLQLFVNGEAHQVTATTLSELLNELSFEGSWLATARNSTLVAAADRPLCRLQAGDRIEILSPMQGG